MSYDVRQQRGDFGISIAALAVQRLGWIFREQTKADHGIDAHLEIVTDGKPTGKLVGLQVTSGPSYFSELKDEGFIFRGSDTHLEYWTNHSLPVVLILVNTETEDVYWQFVEDSAVRRTESGWKLRVPRSNLLIEDARSAIEAIADGSPSERRLQRLQLDVELMRFLQSDNQIFVEAETWPNKSLPRTGITLFSRDEDGEEKLIQPYDMQFGWSLGPLLEHFFPWAEVSIDSDYYFWREDSDTVVGDRPALRPYEDNGETAYWRLELTLNELGRSFLKVADYIDDDVSFSDG